MVRRTTQYQGAASAMVKQDNGDAKRASGFYRIITPDVSRATTIMYWSSLQKCWYQFGSGVHIATSSLKAVGTKVRI